MQELTTKEAQLEKIVEETGKMAENLPKVLSPVKITKETITGNYYDYLIPDGKVFANFNQISGKTIAWNQLVDSGTSSVTLIGGHKYYTLIGGTGSIQTGAGSAISVTGGTDKVTDLTLCFGSGNEPTVEGFQELFTNYANESYNVGTLLSASVDEVISKDSVNNAIAIMYIPSAIQSLTGYGWSAGSAKNYIDFENKKYVQQVGSVDLGSLTWSYSSGDHSRFIATVSDAKSFSYSVVANIVCPFYISRPSSETWAHTSDKIMGLDDKLYIYDSTAGTDADAFKSAMAGVMLYYELATPIETDISSILGGIHVESGGSLTFQNSNGDNYKIHVPVNMDLVADANGFITAQDKCKLDMVYEYIMGQR